MGAKTNNRFFAFCLAIQGKIARFLVAVAAAGASESKSESESSFVRPTRKQWTPVASSASFIVLHPEGATSATSKQRDLLILCRLLSRLRLFLQSFDCRQLRGWKNYETSRSESIRLIFRLPSRIDKTNAKFGFVAPIETQLLAKNFNRWDR